MPYTHIVRVDWCRHISGWCQQLSRHTPGSVVHITRPENNSQEKQEEQQDEKRRKQRRKEQKGKEKQKRSTQQENRRSSRFCHPLGENKTRKKTSRRLLMCHSVLCRRQLQVNPFVVLWFRVTFLFPKLTGEKEEWASSYQTKESQGNRVVRNHATIDDSKWDGPKACSGTTESGKSRGKESCNNRW